jgi:hypothetical protein
MADFSMKWRFTEENYNILPQLHLDQIKPLDSEAARFLSDFIAKNGLHKDFPFKKDLFRNNDKTTIGDDNEKEVKKWLYHRGIPFDKEVFLSYGRDTAIIVPWKLLIKYFDDFQYSDDLTVIDQSLNWALLFFHEGEIYFGTNEDFTPSKLFEDVSFIW